MNQRNLTLNEARNKAKKHIRMARKYLPFLTPKNEKENPEQYQNDKMSFASLVQQAHYFFPSPKTEKLLKKLEKL